MCVHTGKHAHMCVRERGREKEREPLIVDERNCLKNTCEKFFIQKYAAETRARGETEREEEEEERQKVKKV